MFLIFLTTLTVQANGLSLGDTNTYDPAAQGDHIDLAGIPVAAYNADDGAGGGALGGIYWRRPGMRPYKFAIEGIVYITNLNVHTDAVYFDWLQVNDWPLRIIGGLLFWATRDDTFCGFGNNVTCSTAVAEQAATNLGLSGSARDNFVNTYYYRRYIQPTGEIKFFFQLPSPGPKFELMVAWRGSAYIPGVIGHTTPYANNYYAQFYPTGEPGFASVFQAGLMLDTRDIEAAPTQGYWVDTSVRASSPAWGSTWSYIGVNATARNYFAFDTQHNLVLANRFIGDLIFGTPCVVEFSDIGGYATVPGGLQGFGGSDIGRGVRQNRYIGRIRVMDSLELRWTFIGFDVLGEHLELTAVGFTEAAWVGVDYHDFGGDPRKIILTEGAGLRVAWDEDFIVRADIGFSDAEQFDPRVYVSVDNVF